MVILTWITILMHSMHAIKNKDIHVSLLESCFEGSHVCRYFNIRQHIVSTKHCFGSGSSLVDQ